MYGKKKSKMMNRGGATKKSKMMNKGGSTKATKIILSLQFGKEKMVIFMLKSVDFS